MVDKGLVSFLSYFVKWPVPNSAALRPMIVAGEGSSSTVNPAIKAWHHCLSVQTLIASINICSPGFWKDVFPYMGPQNKSILKIDILTSDYTSSKDLSLIWTLKTNTLIIF